MQKNIAVNGMKQVLMGLVLAAAVTFPPHEASGATRILNVLLRTDMVNTVVDDDASGRISGTLIRNGQTSNQRLKLSFANLDPDTAYQLVAFIGDETNPRSVAEFTTDSSGAFGVTYVQKCPGNSSRGGEPLPHAMDPISHIHQLDIVKAGN